MYATNYFETMILNVLRGVQAGAPATVYVGLFLTNPTEAGVGTEVSYTGYQRQAIAFAAPAAMQNGIGVQNSAEITFPIAPSAAGTVTHLGVFDSQTSGNMLVYGELETPQSIEAQEAPVIVAGEAKWWLSGNMSTYFKTKVLNLLRGTSCAGITPYFSMFSGDPDDGGTELSGSNYARLQLAFSSPSEQPTGEMKIATTATVTTARASDSWGTWAYSVVNDAETGGNPIFFKQKSPSKVMRAGLLATITAGDLSLAVN